MNNETSTPILTANPSVKAPNRLYMPFSNEVKKAKPGDVDGFAQPAITPGAIPPRDTYGRISPAEQLPDRLQMSAHRSVTTAQGVAVGGGIFYYRINFTGTCFIFTRPTGISNDMNCFLDDDTTKLFRLCLGTDLGDKTIFYAGLPYKAITIVYNGGNFDITCFSRDIQFTKV
jgi:hypothetical protein